MVKITIDETIRILEENKKFRIIVDVTDSFTTPKFMKSAYNFAEDTKHLMVSGAILGVTGVKKLILGGYNRFVAPHIVVPFETMEEAIEHVTKEE